MKLTQLDTCLINTPIGTMIAVAHERGLCLLEFTDRPHLDKQMKKLYMEMGVDLKNGLNHPLISIKKELDAYFEGELTKFKTPLHIWGTSFQKMVWHELMCIPYGATKSYKDQAISMKMPASYRAVANANGANHMAILIPCHRVCHKDGNLGGYAGGVDRKQWLINHEKQFLNNTQKG